MQNLHPALESQRRPANGLLLANTVHCIIFCKQKVLNLLISNLTRRGGISFSGFLYMPHFAWRDSWAVLLLFLHFYTHSILLGMTFTCTTAPIRWRPQNALQRTLPSTLQPASILFSPRVNVVPFNQSLGLDELNSDY